MGKQCEVMCGKTKKGVVEGEGGTLLTENDGHPGPPHVPPPVDSSTERVTGVPAQRILRGGRHASFSVI